MQIWPAIDLRGGKCVRLKQGNYAQETVYSDDPVQVALRFQEQGARHLHLVDLDGARVGSPQNLQVIERIVSAVDLECELGGGIRDQPTIERLLGPAGGPEAAGAKRLARLVLGTAALKEPQWFAQMCRAYPGRLVLGVDARDGMVATEGWLETSAVHAIDLVAQFQGEPLAGIVYTDIATDGMLQGPNVAAMSQMQEAVEFPVVASGGVTTASDVADLAAAGLAGAIVGRALYEGTLSLTEALRITQHAAR
jgi:phosphoribosylformimino-5-aminoimidazole carboxamide ribotide isomerase